MSLRVLARDRELTLLAGPSLARFLSRAARRRRGLGRLAAVMDCRRQRRGVTTEARGRPAHGLGLAKSS